MRRTTATIISITCTYIAKGSIRPLNKSYTDLIEKIVAGQ